VARRKLTSYQVADVLHRRELGEFIEAVAAEFGVTCALISQIWHGKRRADSLVVSANTN
jgi:uncharacterized protein (DUF433 family)